MSTGFIGVVVGLALVSLIQVFHGDQSDASRVNNEVTPPKSETRLSLIYVGSPDCSWSTRPDVMDAVNIIKQRLRNYALENDMGFAALGVATTANSRAGLRHLNALTQFDVVSIGEHTANAITLDYFWNEGLAPSTPQILVLQREITWADRGALPGEFAGSVVRRLGRASGASALMEWASSSRILPPSSTVVNPSSF
ncbi:hypothetical protein [Candidatus Palauibacter sp.]|uniref:hypothetical protein n=2 Tax=Candidatus Palauibacter sp. TaxID=3101350 RepID=UPI003B51EE83